MSVNNGLGRAGFSPAEFAALFGKSQTWGYRQIYAGRVTAITEYGRILIPAAEVDRIVGSAGRYEGVKKTVRTKEEIQALSPMLPSAWQEFIRQKRAESHEEKPKVKTDAVDLQGGGAKTRRAILERLAGRRDSKVHKLS